MLLRGEDLFKKNPLKTKYADIPGVGKVRPKANWVSKFASTPASVAFCGFCPPLIETSLNEESAAAGFWSSKKSFKSARFAIAQDTP